MQPLLQREHHRPRDGIGDTEAAAKIFERIAKGVERRDHVRPRVCERVYVGPFGNDAVGALPRLDNVGM